ncbi:MAG: iron-containing alcohol dehydrogenase [Tissierellia bacterium]|nr:iron-containing alcohol dehydrogenase [Tissierellia bacterium]
MKFTFDIPTKIYFGVGSIEKLKEIRKKRVAIISNKSNALEICGAKKKITKILEEKNIDYILLNEVKENPDVENVMDITQKIKAFNSDLVIAAGGGSALDAAKISAFMAKNDGEVWDYIKGGSGKEKDYKHKGIDVITIPTTSGTGSEVNPWAVVTNKDLNEKIGFGFMDIFPKIAIIDPTFMLTVPKKYRIYQTFDALFHNIEVIISKDKNILSESLSLKAVELIYHNFIKVLENPNDIKAVEKLAYASTIAGISMQVTDPIIEHAMEHAMSAYHENLEHAAGIIMISKAFFSFLIEKGVKKEEFKQLAKIMGEKGNDPSDFIIGLDKLIKATKMDKLKMKDYGIRKEEFLKFTKNARYTMPDLYKANPIAMTDEEVFCVFENSW